MNNKITINHVELLVVGSLYLVHNELYVLSSIDGLLILVCINDGELWDRAVSNEEMVNTIEREHAKLVTHNVTINPKS